ncbi:MAG: hypothetical protein P8J59_11195, partial [Phycisphaerales bacterium]|nr:hypothetical protein [Phycisphaerales bacterium]
MHMKHLLHRVETGIAAGLLVLSSGVGDPGSAQAQETPTDATPPEIEIAHRGLHGYIGSHAGASPETHRYGAGFYASVWSLIDRPIRNFQIGLPSTWLTPDNSDNRTEPL